MTKQKWIALIVIAVAFLLFFNAGLMDMSLENPMYSLLAFLVVAFAAVFAIFMGNSDKPGNNQSENNHQSETS